ncbi:MAG: LysM peptidoglycan-binding domain-containing protein [Natronincolaceae bacterium]|jgi:N-acetylmuramoyl-L-alanine amidase|nr:LysM peptidoglycan-binding domain-containing protein [Bacillota bacterium]NLK91391.1 LysM peptidoglycan-binding domain-containing protein [Clostridiales bacterium]
MFCNDHSCPCDTTPYTVKAGDTFFRIAMSHNVSLEALLAANPGVDPDRLCIGQVICIPASTAPPPPPTSPLCPLLRFGSLGPSVRRLQGLLSDRGYYPVFSVDTLTALMAFQRDAGLHVDGIADIESWTALGVDCTPRPVVCPKGTMPHAIQAGDTFFNLATKFCTTVTAIAEANPDVDPNFLQIGQIICIPI